MDELLDPSLGEDPTHRLLARRRRRHRWRWTLAALLPVLGFGAGWLVANPTAAPATQAPAVAANLAQQAGPAPALAPGQADPMQLGQEASQRWVEDWAAIARLAEADLTVTGGDPAAAAQTVPAPPPPAAATPVPGDLGIPDLMLQAYQNAERWAAGYSPDCRLSWTIVAAVGQVESRHGQHGGAGIDESGDVRPKIRGPALDGGPGIRAIRDTDDGRLDDDTTWDRAVGPMQFLPTSWASLGRDGNGDGTADPHNAFDATVSAAGYLCLRAQGDLNDPATARRALLAYNNSDAYVAKVLSWRDAFAAYGAPALANPTPG